MIQMVGFTPWAFKYADDFSPHKHGGVATEWQTAMVLSAYNVYLSADACCVQGMANAALFRHYPLKVRTSPRNLMLMLMCGVLLPHRGCF